MSECVDRVIAAYKNEDGSSPFRKKTLQGYEESARAIQEKYKDNPVRLQQELKALVERIGLARQLLNKRLLQNQLKREERQAVYAAFADNPVQGLFALTEGATHPGFGARDSVARLRNVINQEGNNILVHGLKDKNLTAIANNEAAQPEIAQAMFLLGKRGDVSKIRPEILETAKVFTKFNNWAVQTLRHHGIDVGEIPGYIMRQTHDPDRMMAAGFDDWVRGIYPRLDMEKTFGEFAGDTKKEVAMLKRAYDKLTSEGNGIGLNRFSKARSLHFKDGVAFIEYNNEYGYYPTILNSMLEVARTVARESAITSKFGTDRAAALREMKEFVGRKNEHIVDEVWATMRGDDERIGSTPMAKGGRLTRNIITMSRLGMTIKSAMNDTVSSLQAVKTHTGMSWMESGFSILADYLASLSPSVRRAAAREYALNMEDQLFMTMAKLTGDTDIASGFSAKMLHGFFTLNLVGPHTRVAKSGDARSIGRGMRQTLKKGWPKDLSFQRALEGGGFTPLSVENMNLVEGNVISGQAIRQIPLEKIRPPERMSAAQYREKLAYQVQSFINEGVEMGVPTAGKKESRQFGRYRDPDTVRGQAVRFFSQFKMTPMKQFNDALYMNRVRGSKGYLSLAAKIGIFTTIGAVQAYAIHRLWQIAWGEEEEVIYGDGKLNVGLMGEMLAKGGGFGLLGDFIFSAAKPYKRAGEGLAGPGAGTAFQALQLGSEKFAELVNNGELRFTSQDMKFIIYNTPGLGLPFLHGVKQSMLETAKEMAEDSRRR